MNFKKRKGKYVFEKDGVYFALTLEQIDDMAITLAEIQRKAVSDGYRPTAQIKWFRVEGNYVGGEKPLAQIAGYPECGPEWYCLKQLWVSDFPHAPEEWRDIEIGGLL